MKEKIEVAQGGVETTIKKSEESKKIELIEELNSKKMELADRETRLTGGKHPRLNKIIPPIDEEIETLSKVIRMRGIEIERDAPNEAMTKYNYESNEEWRELRKFFLTKELKQMKNSLEQVKEQKVKCEEDIPKLKAEIVALEKEVKQNAK